MSKHTKQQKQLGEDIAFGVQQSLACMATDFLEAPINDWVQRQNATAQHQGTLWQNYVGEFAGNAGSLLTFLGLRQFFPQSVEWIKHSSRALFDGFYDKVGRRSLKRWAQAHHVEVDSDKYQEKLAEWKDFQADNFAKSSVIQVSSLAFNVVGQKAVGNTHKASTILLGKLAGGVLTMAAVLGFRLVAPKTAKQFDEELSDRYFTPLVHKTQKLLGADEKDPEQPSPVRGPATDLVELELGLRDDDLDEEKHEPSKHARRLQKEVEEIQRARH
jgi:hypothetical protein